MTVHVTFSDMSPVSYLSGEALVDQLEASRTSLARATNDGVILDYRHSDSTPAIYEVELDGVSGAGACEVDPWKAAARLEAEAQGADFGQADVVLFIFPEDDGCTFAGLGGGGEASVWWSHYESHRTIVHELSHAIGLPHSSSDTDNDGVIDAEYGDQSCMMGGNTTVHSRYNAMQRDQLGVIEPHQKASALTSGGYRLSSIDSTQDEQDASKFLTVFGPGIDDYYYLSLQAPGPDFPGLESGVVVIHRREVFPGGLTRSINSESLLVGQLLPGEVFAPGPELEIVFTGLTDEGAVAEVEVSYLDIEGPWPDANVAPISHDQEFSVEAESSFTFVTLDFEDDGPMQDYRLEVVEGPEIAILQHHTAISPLLGLYRPSGATGTDEITWRVSDGLHSSSDATLTVHWE